MSDKRYPRLNHLLKTGLAWLDGEIYCMLDDDGGEIIIGWMYDLGEAEDYLADIGEPTLTEMVSENGLSEND